MPRGRGASFQGIAYRHTAPAFARVGPQLLEGSRRSGGRFNPPGEFGALYLSLDVETVGEELRRAASRAGIPVEALVPRSLLVVRVELSHVLDLTDPAEQRRWGLDRQRLAADDHAACQEAGRAARRAGYEAVLFPSAARPGGKNLAVFLDCLHPGSEVRVESQEPLRVDGEGS